MSKNTRPAVPARFALAAVLAAGMTTAPFAISTASGLTSKVALAGDAAEFQPGSYSRSAAAGNDSTGPMATLGVTEHGPKAATGHELDVIARHIAAYKRAMIRGELALAADNLVAAAQRPITEKLVTTLNTELGVQTPLADVQIAQAAAALQKATS